MWRPRAGGGRPADPLNETKSPRAPPAVPDGLSSPHRGRGRAGAPGLTHRLFCFPKSRPGGCHCLAQGKRLIFRKFEPLRESVRRVNRLFRGKKKANALAVDPIPRLGRSLNLTGCFRVPGDNASFRRAVQSPTYRSSPTLPSLPERATSRNEIATRQPGHGI